MAFLKPRKIWLFRISIGMCCLAAALAILVYYCNKVVSTSAAGRLYATTSDIPYRKTGILLGTAKYLANGTENYYYRYRIQAAAALIKSGKIRYLVISGDNSRKSYNEPESMRSDLMALGIDTSLIFLDYAGFRTFDSIIRLREIFGQHAATVISQPFHNTRAIYIGKREKMDLIGFNAQDLAAKSGWRVQVREKLARTKVFLDYWLGKKPKYLGTPIAIPAS